MDATNVTATTITIPATTKTDPVTSATTLDTTSAAGATVGTTETTETDDSMEGSAWREQSAAEAELDTALSVFTCSGGLSVVGGDDDVAGGGGFAGRRPRPGRGGALPGARRRYCNNCGCRTCNGC